jgi:hypothetical protein
LSVCPIKQTSAIHAMQEEFELVAALEASEAQANTKQNEVYLI